MKKTIFVTLLFLVNLALASGGDGGSGGGPSLDISKSSILKMIREGEISTSLRSFNRLKKVKERNISINGSKVKFGPYMESVNNVCLENGVQRSKTKRDIYKDVYIDRSKDTTDGHQNGIIRIFDERNYLYNYNDEIYKTIEVKRKESGHRLLKYKHYFEYCNE